MLNEKMHNVMEDVNREIAEREELVHMIALALLTRKNLFVLRKNYREVVNEFGKILL